MLTYSAFLRRRADTCDGRLRKLLPPKRRLKRRLLLLRRRSKRRLLLPKRRLKRRLLLRRKSKMKLLLRRRSKMKLPPHRPSPNARCVLCRLTRHAVTFLPRVTHACLQAAATASIKGKPGIIEAARDGDIKLVQDHLTADASCVGCRDPL